MSRASTKEGGEPTLPNLPMLWRLTLSPAPRPRREEAVDLDEPKAGCFGGGSVQATTGNRIHQRSTSLDQAHFTLSFMRLGLATIQLRPQLSPSPQMNALGVEGTVRETPSFFSFFFREGVCQKTYRGHIPPAIVWS